MSVFKVPSLRHENDNDSFFLIVFLLLHIVTLSLNRRMTESITVCLQFNYADTRSKFLITFPVVSFLLIARRLLIVSFIEGARLS